jgi:hypothetical protein
MKVLKIILLFTIFGYVIQKVNVQNTIVSLAILKVNGIVTDCVNHFICSPPWLRPDYPTMVPEYFPQNSLPVSRSFFTPH